MEGAVVDPVLHVDTTRPHCDPLGHRLGTPPPVVGDQQHRPVRTYRVDFVRTCRRETFEIDITGEIPDGVPGLGDPRDPGRIPTLQGGGDVEPQGVTDDMRRHHRRGGEQLRVVDDAPVRQIVDARFFLTRLALDTGDVEITGLAGGVETGVPARLRGPGEQHVITGDGFAVGIHGIIGDLVIQHQWVPADHRHRAEVVIGQHLPLRTVEAEPRQYPREGLRSRRGRTVDRIGVVTTQDAVDGEVDLFGRAAGTGHENGRSQHSQYRRDAACGRAAAPQSHRDLSFPLAGGPPRLHRTCSRCGLVGRG